jgi:hypothetical protein
MHAFSMSPLLIALSLLHPPPTRSKTLNKQGGEEVDDTGASVWPLWDDKDIETERFGAEAAGGASGTKKEKGVSFVVFRGHLHACVCAEGGGGGRGFWCVHARQCPCNACVL